MGFTYCFDLTILAHLREDYSGAHCLIYGVVVFQVLTVIQMYITEQQRSLTL